MAHLAELDDFRKYTGPAEYHKSVNSLLGLLTGISVDNQIDNLEYQELKNWYDLYRGLMDRSPFNEILPAIDAALEDHVLELEEVEDLIWLCRRYCSDGYYDFVTSKIQQLHGIFHGILSNNRITDAEINGLREWLLQHDYLRGVYPFDEIHSLVSTITEDGIITDEERNILKVFLAEFIDFRDSFNIHEPELNMLREQYSVSGICAKDPQITVPEHTFCFTGASSYATRDEIASVVVQHGGTFSNSINKKVNYLVVGAEGNPCWAFSCYGRKIEKVVELRKKGLPIIIANEHDFWKALGQEMIMQ